MWKNEYIQELRVRSLQKGIMVTLEAPSPQHPFPQFPQYWYSQHEMQSSMESMKSMATIKVKQEKIEEVCPLIPSLSKKFCPRRRSADCVQRSWRFVSGAGHFFAIVVADFQ